MRDGANWGRRGKRLRGCVMAREVDEVREGAVGSVAVRERWIWRMRGLGEEFGMG
jgi:hypothetical protein